MDSPASYQRTFSEPKDQRHRILLDNHQTTRNAQITKNISDRTFTKWFLPKKRLLAKLPGLTKSLRLIITQLRGASPILFHPFLRHWRANRPQPSTFQPSAMGERAALAGRGSIFFTQVTVPPSIWVINVGCHTANHVTFLVHLLDSFKPAAAPTWEDRPPCSSLPSPREKPHQPPIPPTNHRLPP